MWLYAVKVYAVTSSVPQLPRQGMAAGRLKDAGVSGTKVWAANLNNRAATTFPPRARKARLQVW